MLTVRFTKPEATNIPVIHATAGQMLMRSLRLLPSRASTK